MVYIIQTNTSLDDKGNPRDFQSMIFTYDSWDIYKHHLLIKESDGRIINGTMIGCIKPRASVIEKIIKNDDFHVECIINNGVVTINVKAYKVDEYNFNQFAKRYIKNEI